MTPEQQIAEFMAKKGVTKIPAGQAALNLTGREWAAKVRGESTAREKCEEREQNKIRVVIDHAGREFYMNSEGEWL